MLCGDASYQGPGFRVQVGLALESLPQPRRDDSLLPKLAGSQVPKFTHKDQPCR